MRTALASLFGLLGLGLGLGVPIYWWITYSGVYRWLAEVQLGWFDGYYAILTGVLSLAVGCVAFVPPCVWLAARIEPRDPHAADDPSRADAERLGRGPAPPTPEERLQRDVRARSLGCLGVLSLVVVPVLCVGLWQLLEANQLGPKQALDLASVEAGVAPPSRWVEFEARPAWREAAGIKDKHVVTRYAPVRSAPGAVAGVVVKVPARAVDLSRRQWAGTLSEGAPGVIVSAFARDGRVREPVWVLSVDKTPADARRIAWSMFEVGGGMLVIGLIAIGVLRRRWRNARPAHTPD